MNARTVAATPTFLPPEPLRAEPAMFRATLDEASPGETAVVLFMVLLGTCPVWLLAAALLGG